MIAAASERVEYRKRIRASEPAKSTRSVSGSLTRTVLVIVNLKEEKKRRRGSDDDGDMSVVMMVGLRKSGDEDMGRCRVEI